jgi:tetratricopeptide (TPR) repeat protein
VNESGNGDKKRSLLPYLSRIMPIGAIIVLLMLLIPQLMEMKRGKPGLAYITPPLAMKYYSTGYAKTDSLMNAALRSFSSKDYEEAARLLTKVHFFWTVSIREGRVTRYPADLRFYLGLAHFYRGRPDQGIPYLEDEERNSPYEEKYPWYLAHLYIARGQSDKARRELERVVQLNGQLAAEAAEKLRMLR